jgi:hypothetical protein
MNDVERKQFDRVELAMHRTLSRAWKGERGLFDGDPGKEAERAITGLMELFRKRPELALHLYADLMQPFAHAAFTAGLATDY